MVPGVLQLIAIVATGAECHGAPSPNAQPNKNPIITAPPKLVPPPPTAFLPPAPCVG